jgi:hypothetical protein
MNPNLGHILFQTAVTLGTRVSPHLAGVPYAAGDVATSGLLMILAAQHAEKAASVLVWENRALRDLLGRTAEVTRDPARAAALAGAADGTDTDLGLTPLAMANARLRGLVIPLHAEVELREDPAARSLDHEILSLLREGAHRRRLVVPSAA